jgi:hypothetical protein
MQFMLGDLREKLAPVGKLELLDDGGAPRGRLLRRARRPTAATRTACSRRSRGSSAGRVLEARADLAGRAGRVSARPRPIARRAGPPPRRGPTSGTRIARCTPTCSSPTRRQEPGRPRTGGAGQLPRAARTRRRRGWPSRSDQRRGAHVRWRCTAAAIADRSSRTAASSSSALAEHRRARAGDPSRRARHRPVADKSHPHRAQPTSASSWPTPATICRARSATFASAWRSAPARSRGTRPIRAGSRISRSATTRSAGSCWSKKTSPRRWSSSRRPAPRSIARSPSTRPTPTYPDGARRGQGADRDRLPGAGRSTGGHRRVHGVRRDLGRARGARPVEPRDWQRARTLIANKLGDVRMKADDPRGALAAYQSAVTIRARLVATDPHNTGWRRDLFYSHYKIAHAHRAAKDRAAGDRVVPRGDRDRRGDAGGAPRQRDVRARRGRDPRRARGPICARTASRPRR